MPHLNERLLIGIGSKKDWEEDWDGIKYLETEVGDQILFNPTRGTFHLNELNHEISWDKANEIVWNAKNGIRRDW